MSQNTLLAKLAPLIRSLTDLSLNLSGTLVAYDDVTLYRYSIKETDYGDKEKTLLQTVENVHMYLDFPGEVPNLNTYVQSLTVQTVLFIEDLLPIMAIFPWKHRGSWLKVDLEDEFTVPFFDELDNTHTIRFTIKEMRSDYVQQHLYREYVVVPTRVDETDLTVDSGGQPKDANIEVGKETKDVYSEYD